MNQIKDKISNMPGCMVMPVVLLCVFIPMLIFDVIQKSDNSSVREAAEMRVHEVYEEKIALLNNLVDSLNGEMMVYDDALGFVKRKLDRILDNVTFAQESLSEKQLYEVEDYLDEIASECDYSDIER